MLMNQYLDYAKLNPALKKSEHLREDGKSCCQYFNKQNKILWSKFFLDKAHLMRDEKDKPIMQKMYNDLVTKLNNELNVIVWNRRCIDVNIGKTNLLTSEVLTTDDLSKLSSSCRESQAFTVQILLKKSHLIENLKNI